MKNKKVRSLFQIILSFGLLAYFINDIGLDTIIEELITIDKTWYLLAFLLFELNMVIRSYRWYILLQSLNQQADFKHLLYLYYLGFFANNFIPSGFGGDVVKVVNLRQHYGRGTEALSSVIMDRLTGLLGTTLIALIALTLNALGHTTALDLPLYLWISIVGISFGIPIAFLLLRSIDLLAILERRLPLIQRLPRYPSLQNLARTVNRYPLPVLLKSLLISLPFTINWVLVQYAIALALDVDLPIHVYFLFVPIISIVNLLPISFNGLGVRDGVYLLLFVPIGVAPELVIAMSLAFYFLRFITGVMGGLLYALRSVLFMLRAPESKNL